MSERLRDRLIGAWKLLSYQEIPVDSADSFEPLGPRQRGLIIYTSDGYMSAQLSTRSGSARCRRFGRAARPSIRNSSGIGPNPTDHGRPYCPPVRRSTLSNAGRVVVTAGAGGIGLAITKAFAANGDRVHICDINEKAPQRMTDNAKSISAQTIPIDENSMAA